MVNKAYVFGLIAVGLLTGCGVGEKESVEQKLSEWTEKAIEHPVMQDKRVETAVEWFKSIAKDQVNWGVLKDELNDAVDLKTGFYEFHSPMRRKSGLVPLDELLIAARKLRDAPLDPSRDINGTLEKIIKLSLREQFKMHGFTEDQINELIIFIP